MATRYGSGQDYSQLKFLKGHLTAQIDEPKGDLRERVALITGATSGLGYAAAQHFARLNTSTIVFAVRNPTKAKSYVEQLYKDVPTYRGEVKTLALDLTSFASVRSFVKELDAAVPRLDFALLNAGVINMEHVETEDGWLADIQVNVLSTGLLALLLLPKLNATAKLPQPTGGEPADLKPQLHIVASEVHYWVRPATQKLMTDADNLLKTVCSREFRSKIPFDEIYNLTKLCDVWLTRKIGALDAAKAVQVTCSSPGLCKSGLRDSMGPFAAWLINVLSWRSEFGTRTYLQAMLSPQPQGAFIFAGKVQPPSTFACSPEGVRLEDKLWDESRQVWEEAAPEVKEVLAV
ncbi:hypothetical protein DMC30DRAFT_414608 [Rhodotorula diobovata]|uniref:NAD(P)-binding protein n=1 Tax=Rhodotorula diobovata TaxID=5288 RepID=A0A5C5G1M9_9BASI|nr:hypothetical protein DMC30DRAFT_414608 [Rhodotorula diobovata]